MMGLFGRLFARDPALATAQTADAGAIASLHAEAFRRGWSEDEVERLLVDRRVVADRALIGRTLAGFVLSRGAAGEAEILSIAVARRRRGRGLAKALLDRHLRRLAGLGVAAVFLEVEETNEPARRLYARAGFREVGRRDGYYARPGGAVATALVLRRDLT